MFGQFVSVWNDGEYEVRTKCEFSPETFEIFHVETSDENVENLHHLDIEYIEDSDGNEYEVCSDCHNRILESRIVPTDFKMLEEEKFCRDCENA